MGFLIYWKISFRWVQPDFCRSIRLEVRALESWLFWQKWLPPRCKWRIITRPFFDESSKILWAFETTQKDLSDGSNPIFVALFVWKWQVIKVGSFRKSGPLPHDCTWCTTTLLYLDENWKTMSFLFYRKRSFEWDQPHLCTSIRLEMTAHQNWSFWFKRGKMGKWTHKKRHNSAFPGLKL